MVFLPVCCATVESGFCVDFVDQDVAAVAGLDHGVSGCGIARDDDGAVGSFKSESEGELPGAVGYRKCGHRHILVLVDLSGLDLVDIDLDSSRILGLAAMEADFDVLGVGGEDVVGHRSDPGRSEDREWFFPFEYPGCEDEVGVAGRVVGVKVGDEKPRKIGHVEGRHAGEMGRRCAANDTGTAVDEVWPAAGDDRDRRSSPLGIRVRGAGAEYDEDGVVCWGRRRWYRAGIGRQ